MAFHCREELLAPGSGGKAERGDIQGVELEEVAVRPVAVGRAGAAIARLAEIVRAAEGKSACPEALGQIADLGPDIVENPVAPHTAGRIRIFHDQRETASLAGRAAPFERGRDIRTLTGVQRRNEAAVLEGVGEELKRHKQASGVALTLFQLTTAGSLVEAR